MAVCLEYQLVHARKRIWSPRLRTQLMAATFLLIALAFKVWIKTEVTDVGYRLAKARQVMVSLDMERRELELQKSVLLRPDNLRKAAEKRLGLQPLLPRQARRVRE